MAQANQQQHLNLLNKLFDEVYTKGNVNALDQICTEDIKLNDPATPNVRSGIQGLKDIETTYRNAFPNKTMKIDQTWNTEDSIIAYWTCQASHKGPLGDLPPTGKNFKITGIIILKIKGDRISEMTRIWDRYGLLEQLGFSMHAGAR